MDSKYEVIAGGIIMGLILVFLEYAALYEYTGSLPWM